MGDFAYMAFIVIVLMAGQAVLWAWVGLRAGQVLPWWPFKLTDDQSNEQQKSVK